MFSCRRLLQFLSSIIIITMLASGIHLPSVSAQGKGDGLKRQVNAQTGKVSFLGPESGRSLPVYQALGTGAAIRPQDPALALAKRFGPEFGLKDPAHNLKEIKNKHAVDGRITARYQQSYQAIPIMGGELIVNTNDNGDLYSMNGEVSADLSLSTQATIDSEQARQTALQAVAKWYQKTTEDFIASEPQLWIYDENLLQPDRKSTRLNSSHVEISYAVFCLKKKKKKTNLRIIRHSISATSCQKANSSNSRCAIILVIPRTECLSPSSKMCSRKSKQTKQISL